MSGPAAYDGGRAPHRTNVAQGQTPMMSPISVNAAVA